MNTRYLVSHTDYLLNKIPPYHYFRVLQSASLDAQMVTPVFQDWSGGKYKVVAFHAKRARGLMTRYAAQNGLAQAEQLIDFDSDGYAFDAAASNESRWVFRRGK